MNEVPSLSTLSDPAAQRLLVELLSGETSVRIRVTGRSMAPFILDGDILTITPAGREAACAGEVVVYVDGAARLIAHRVLARRESAGGVVLTLQGDAGRAAVERVRRDRVLGRVRVLERGGRVIALDGGPWRLASVLWSACLPLSRRLVGPATRCVSLLFGIAARK